MKAVIYRRSAVHNEQWLNDQETNCASTHASTV